MTDNVRNLRGENGADDDAGDKDEKDKSLEELEAERARLAAEQEEADGQFALEIPEAKRKINLGTIIPRGVPVELKYKMTGKSIPNVKGGGHGPGRHNRAAARNPRGRGDLRQVHARRRSEHREGDRLRDRRCTPGRQRTLRGRRAAAAG